MIGAQEHEPPAVKAPLLDYLGDGAAGLLALISELLGRRGILGFMTTRAVTGDLVRDRSRAFGVPQSSTWWPAYRSVRGAVGSECWLDPDSYRPAFVSEHGRSGSVMPRRPPKRHRRTAGDELDRHGPALGEGCDGV